MQNNICICNWLFCTTG